MDNSKTIEEFQQKLNDLPDLLMAEVMKRVAERTPVDTGAAQDGYEVTKDGHNYQLKNKEDYVVYLEVGTEHQSPVGMVRTTVLEMDSITQESANKLGL